jgi:hypothetical protein
MAQHLTQESAPVASFDGAVYGRNKPNFHTLFVGLSRKYGQLVKSRFRSAALCGKLAGDPMDDDLIGDKVGFDLDLAAETATRLKIPQLRQIA